jgi:hypothetical protein
MEDDMDNGSISEDSDSISNFMKKLELSDKEVRRCSIGPTMIAWINDDDDTAIVRLW